MISNINNINFEKVKIEVYRQNLLHDDDKQITIWIYEHTHTHDIRYGCWIMIVFFVSH